jgi:hypothetical protein
MFNLFKKKSKKHENENNQERYEKRDPLAEKDQLVLQNMVSNKNLFVAIVDRYGRMEYVTVKINQNHYVLAADTVENLNVCYQILQTGKLNGMSVSDERFAVLSMSDFAIQKMGLPDISQIGRKTSGHTYYYCGVLVYTGDQMDLFDFDDILEVCKRC